MANSIRILVIDDEEISLRTTIAILKRNGYVIFTNTTAIDIFNTIDKCTPDLVIIDHDMPDLKGGDAVKLIKSNEAYKTIPVILFSSRHDLSQIALESGADAFVAKGIKKYDELDMMIKKLAYHTM